ncbi:hypothetical protein KSS87_018777 [Heliosperma pusillum]|nr:hypothetical protein KSS87_018777 [Heliosperma pusillum]
MRTTLLAQECSHLDRLMQPIKDGWVKNGMSLCSDWWSNGSNKPIINTMAASGTSSIFLVSVYASGIRKDATYIAQIFSDAIDEIRVEHVAQVLTDNRSNFKGAGDKYDVDAEISELADLSIDDPELEGVIFDLGDQDGEWEMLINGDV